MEYIIEFFKLNGLSIISKVILPIILAVSDYFTDNPNKKLKPWFRISLLLIALAGIIDIINDHNSNKQMDVLITKINDCDSAKAEARKLGFEWDDFKKEWHKNDTTIIVNNYSNIEPKFTYKQIKSVIDTVYKYLGGPNGGTVAFFPTPSTNSRLIQEQLSKELKKHGFKIDAVFAPMYNEELHNKPLNFHYDPENHELLICLNRF